MSEEKELDAAVDEFAAAMKKRLRSKLRQGWRGWDDATIKHDLRKRLVTNAAQAFGGDAKSMIDVANFSMMLWRTK